VLPGELFRDEPVPQDAFSAIHELVEALRLTVEYVGTDTLPPLEGWSWYDALKKYAPDIAKQFQEHHVKLNKIKEATDEHR
jgi:hypothetical protein